MIIMTTESLIGQSTGHSRTLSSMVAKMCGLISQLVRKGSVSHQLTPLTSSSAQPGSCLWFGQTCQIPPPLLQDKVVT